MKSFMMLFEMWKALMSSNSSTMMVYQSMFWDYLNYSYISSIKTEWRWAE
jgi:hypothetical protein